MKDDRSPTTSTVSPAENIPLHDEQNTRDTRELPIDKVGVRGLRFRIQVRDRAHAMQNTVATIGMSLTVPLAIVSEVTLPPSWLVARRKAVWMRCAARVVRSATFASASSRSAITSRCITMATSLCATVAHCAAQGLGPFEA